MSDILFYNPDAFQAYQVCTCSNSRMVDDMQLEQGEIKNDKITMRVTSHAWVCSVCKTKPYPRDSGHPPMCDD